MPIYDFLFDFLWTTSLYLVPFSRYSTSKCLGFDLDLWPLKVIWGWISSYHSKAHMWLPIWLLWTIFLYLVPFSRYSTSKFLGFDLDLWTLKVIWSRNFYTIRKPIYDFLFDFYEHHLSISYRSRDILLQSSRVWPWPLTPTGHLESKNFIPFESSYTTSYFTYMDNISLSRSVLDIFDFEVFWVWPWPLTPKGHLGSKNFKLFESPYMTSYLTSLNTISLSRIVLDIFDFKVSGFDLDLGPLNVIWG